MNDLIEQIFRSGYVEDAQGNTYEHRPSSVSLEVGTLLYDFIRAVKPEKTLEIGMAYGISSLFICQALHDNEIGSHTAIDPFEDEKFKSIGLLNIERAHLEEIFRFFNTPSHQVLPQLLEQNEQFDFAFIDGGHLFDKALIDFFYIDKLLNIGGHVAIDDLWMPGIRKVASFVLKNRSYQLLRPPLTHSTPVQKRILRAGRRILQNPFGRDWALKFVPQNAVLLEKISDDTRYWKYHQPF